MYQLIQLKDIRITKRPTLVRPPYTTTALLSSILVKEKLLQGGGFVPFTGGDDPSPEAVEEHSDVHDNTGHSLQS